MGRARQAQGTDIPVLAHGAGPGPTVAITAAVHGDEPAGFAAVLELDRWLPDHLRRGKVVLYPAVNPSGLAARSRAFPEDLGDLNRVFPGEERGSASSRHANALWRDLSRRRPDLVIDLHADSPAAVPYAIVDRAVSWRPDPAFDLNMIELARAAGFPVLREYPLDQYVRFGLDRSLAGAVVNGLRVPALTLEVGPRRTIDPSQTHRMVRAVIGVLARVGLCDGPGNPPWTGPIYQRGNAPRTHAAGLFVPSVAPGERFDRGQELGGVWSPTAERLESLSAEGAGIAVSWLDGAWVDVGGTPGTLGLEGCDG